MAGASRRQVKGRARKDRRSHGGKGREGAAASGGPASVTVVQTSKQRQGDDVPMPAVRRAVVEGNLGSGLGGCGGNDDIGSNRTARGIGVERGTRSRGRGTRAGWSR